MAKRAWARRGCRDLVSSGAGVEGLCDQLPLILSGVGHGLRTVINATCDLHQLRITPIFAVDSVAIIKDLAMRGIGCSVLPFATVRGEAARRVLKARAIVSPTMSRVWIGME